MPSSVLFVNRHWPSPAVSDYNNHQRVHHNCHCMLVLSLTLRHKTTVKQERPTHIECFSNQFLLLHQVHWFLRCIQLLVGLTTTANDINDADQHITVTDAVNHSQIKSRDVPDSNFWNLAGTGCGQTSTTVSGQNWDRTVWWLLHCPASHDVHQVV